MIQKTAFIGILLLINVSAAIFMIIESATYYTMVQNGHVLIIAGVSLWFIPWLGAVLAEVFQHIMMIMNSKTRLVWYFRFLAAMLFCLTVIAAGYRTLKPIELVYLQNEKTEKIAGVLNREIEDNRADRDIFKNTQQTNTAVSVIERRKAADELKQLYINDEKEKISSLSFTELIQLFLLRVAIQLSALTCAWKIGQIYRANEKRKIKILRQWRVPGEIGFVGIAEMEDKTFMAVSKNSRGQYKTFNGAVNFFKNTKYAGRIPLQSVELGD